MELIDLTTELQTQCHEGHSKTPVLIRMYDTLYKVGSVHQVSIGENTFFEIEAVPIADR